MPPAAAAAAFARFEREADSLGMGRSSSEGVVSFRFTGRLTTALEPPIAESEEVPACAVDEEEEEEADAASLSRSTTMSDAFRLRFSIY